jgi:3-hydroxybutyrate dehydrogenase
MPERFLEGRTALVTGSVQGIGLAIGKALASAGARLAVHGLATREQADAAVRTMRESGAPDARFFDADMRKPAAIAIMMDGIKAWEARTFSSITRASSRPPVSPKSRKRFGTIYWR